MSRKTPQERTRLLQLGFQQATEKIDDRCAVCGKRLLGGQWIRRMPPGWRSDVGRRLAHKSCVLEEYLRLTGEHLDLSPAAPEEAVTAPEPEPVGPAPTPEFREPTSPTTSPRAKRSTGRGWPKISPLKEPIPRRSEPRRNTYEGSLPKHLRPVD